MGMGMGDIAGRFPSDCCHDLRVSVAPKDAFDEASGTCATILIKSRIVPDH